MFNFYQSIFFQQTNKQTNKKQTLPFALPNILCHSCITPFLSHIFYFSPHLLCLSLSTSLSLLLLLSRFLSLILFLPPLSIIKTACIFLLCILFVSDYDVILPGKCLGNAWEMPGKCLGNGKDISQGKN